MKCAVASFVAVFISAVLAAPSPNGCKVKESVRAPPGWVKHAPAPENHTIKLRIALPQPNFETLEQHLYEVSDPMHERYGQHLSKQEVDQIVAPHPESLTAVDKWLASHGIPNETLIRSSAQDWVTLTVPLKLAETMLDTTYHIYKHLVSGDEIVRTTEYSLPEDLHKHIDFVQPTTLFSRFDRKATTFHREDDLSAAEKAEIVAENASGKTVTTPSGAVVDASCNRTVTVTCLKQLYNAVGYKASAKNGNQIGITGYLEEFANKVDLQLFYQDQVPAAVNTSFKFISINGGLNNQSASEAGAEADLDVEFAFGIAFPTPGTFWSTAGRPPFIPAESTPTNTNEPYTDWLDFVLSHPNPPQSISTSYDDDEQTVPKSFAIRACNGFAQLGARGVSLMFSSGDGGVGDGDPDPATQTCFSNDGKNTTKFLPLFPSSCPFVTSVGGTFGVPESAVDFSGGGFSNYFPRPLYQAVAVPKFLSKLPKGTYKGLFNPAGRGIPDVAAQGNRFRVFIGGQAGLIGGTSASSPAFTGFVALLNDARLSKHLPPLGFLNPLLYTIGVAGLNDITTGSAPGCGTPGFNATQGWDPVTGLGTPNFGKLKDIVLGPFGLL